MAYLSLIETAMELGFSPELVAALTKKCPKPGESRRLPAKKLDGQPVYVQRDVEAYRDYLHNPWSLPPKGTRPHIPKCIADDVKAEAHFMCAICGFMDNGELAHIDPVRETLDNSPDNLIFLCPNHHTKYDYGFAPSSNVSRIVVLAAKEMKRASRLRILRHEANACAALRALLDTARRIEARTKATDDEGMRAVYTTELRNLLSGIPELSAKANEASNKDQNLSDIDKLIAEKAPNLSRLSVFPGTSAQATDAAVRSAAKSVVEAAEGAILDLDEVDCPHCGGRGQTGLSSKLCIYCKGDCVVSEAKALQYDVEDLDEVDCPHCGGQGQTGLAASLCTYCKGDCTVSHEKADSYRRDEIDEVDCQHCAGTGQTGFAGAVCAYCKGDCTVSHAKAAAYRPEAIDEVECPHCRGSGQTGMAGAVCSYCKGDCVVSQQKAAAYRPEDLDEQDCPHCAGAGQTGSAGKVCVFCKGDCVVSAKKAARYDPDAIDEVACPHCGGTGQTGLSGKVCGLCKGDHVVTRAVAREYRKRRRS